MKLLSLNQLPRYWKPAAGGLVGLAWLAFVVMSVAPVVRSAVSGHRELGDLERRIVALDGWTGAKLLMERDLASNEPAVRETWERLFPAERGREQLFLDLARVADETGVDDFDLAEIVELDLDPGEPIGQQVDDFDPMADDDPYAQSGKVEAAAAGITLGSYRVRAQWTGNYGRTAAFLAGLREIPRALSVHSLAIRPYLDGIQVDMELEVYTDGATES